MCDAFLTEMVSSGKYRNTQRSARSLTLLIVVEPERFSFRGAPESGGHLDPLRRFTPPQTRANTGRLSNNYDPQLCPPVPILSHPITVFIEHPSIALTLWSQQGPGLTHLPQYWVQLNVISTPIN